MQGWKPVLVYAKGEKYAGRNFVDVIGSERSDKEHHRWGQSESGFAALVDRFSEPGDTVLDPFLGGGTTAVVALESKRRFIGIENEPEAYQTARERL